MAAPARSWGKPTYRSWVSSFAREGRPCGGTSMLMGQAHLSQLGPPIYRNGEAAPVAAPGTLMGQAHLS